MMKKMKNNNINKTGLIIGAFCLIMVSCKAPSLTPTEKIELPEFYMDRETDSTTISSMSWKTFFPDTLLQSYIAEALNNNHSFLQTIERISIARSQVRVGKGALLPDLSLGIDGGVQRFGEYTMDGVGNSTTNTPDLEKDKLHDGRLGRNLLLYIILESLPFHHLLLGHYNQIGTIHIRVQQRTVHQFVGSVL